MFNTYSRREQRQLQADDLVLFLDFDGVLHPDAVYRTRCGLELRAPGALMMHAPILVEILSDFPKSKSACLWCRGQST